MTVVIGVRNNANILTIIDDGAGFNLRTAEGHGGLGSIGMKERALLANGQLSIPLSQAAAPRLTSEIPLP